MQQALCSATTSPASYRAKTKDQPFADVIFGTIHNNQSVKQGRGLARTGVIQLAIDGLSICGAEQVPAQHRPLIQVRPLKSCKVGTATTGSEIY